MPIYEYLCKHCGVVDIMQKMSEGTKRKCPECGALGLKKLVSAPAFQLKGTGWYVTDFRDKDKKDTGKKDEADSKTTETPKSDSTAESKSDSKTETKSDSKADSKSETKSDTKSETKKGSSGRAA